MNTSRKDGILVLHTKKPYKMASGGQITEQTEVICKELGYDEEPIAYDIEQLFTSAMIDIANKTKDLNQNASKPVEDDFESKDNPTEAEVSEKANSLSVMFKMNSASKVSELVKLFQGFVTAGLIQAFGNIPMTDIIWKTIDRNDRLNIIFSYITFFVRPLASLSNNTPEN